MFMWYLNVPASGCQVQTQNKTKKQKKKKKSKSKFTDISVLVYLPTRIADIADIDVYDVSWNRINRYIRYRGTQNIQDKE